jgi:hypothetical protein
MRTRARHSTRARLSNHQQFSDSLSNLATRRTPLRMAMRQHQLRHLPLGPRLSAICLLMVLCLLHLVAINLLPFQALNLLAISVFSRPLTLMLVVLLFPDLPHSPASQLQSLHDHLEYDLVLSLVCMLALLDHLDLMPHSLALHIQTDLEVATLTILDRTQTLRVSAAVTRTSPAILDQAAKIVRAAFVLRVAVVHHRRGPSLAAADPVSTTQFGKLS